MKYAAETGAMNFVQRQQDARQIGQISEATTSPRLPDLFEGVSMKKMSGRCLCEAIVYQIEGELGPIFNCHCSKCRRWHGAAFRTRASIRKSQFKWLAGEELLSRFKSSENVTKTFCSVCGSNLASFYENDPDLVGIPLGGLEQDPGSRPLAHMFAGSKAPWHEITDDLPQHDEWPDSEAAVRSTKV